MGQGSSSTNGRVVVLSHDACWAATTASGAGAAETLIRAGSVWEAAAELLAGNARALVVDMRCLAARDVRLLAIARHEGVPVICVGHSRPGMECSELAGAIRTGADDLAEAIARACLGGPGDVVESEPNPDERANVVRPPSPSPAGLLTRDELSALLDRNE